MQLCALLSEKERVQNGVIIHSDLLLDYLKSHYPDLYFVSSTTKVLTDFADFLNEIKNDDFLYVVPDFRLNKAFDRLNTLPGFAKKQGGIFVQRMLFLWLYGQKTLL